MIVETFVLTAFQQNTRVVACERTRKAICIDPGEASAKLINFLHTNDLDLQAIALTHGHLDHVGGTSALARAFPDAEILLHAGDENLYYALPQQPLFLGIQPHQMRELGMDYEDPPPPTRNWQPGAMYGVGDLRFSVRHCPGHTTGHVVLAEERRGAVFVGDCLFRGSIGRTDLPGGDRDQLLESIHSQILSLDEATIVYSGHGPETTVGTEKATNPFLTGAYSKIGGRYV